MNHSVRLKMCKFDERDAFYTFVRCTFVMPVLKAGRTDWKTLKRSFLTYKTHHECPDFKLVNSCKYKAL